MEDKLPKFKLEGHMEIIPCKHDIDFSVALTSLPPRYKCKKCHQSFSAEESRSFRSVEIDENDLSELMQGKYSPEMKEEINALNELFSYHKPELNQIPRYQAIRDSAKEFAKTVMACCPHSADRTDAIRKIREAVMMANASIALNGLNI